MTLPKLVARFDHTYNDIIIQYNLSKLTYHGTDLKWSILGGSRLWELEYHCSGIVRAIVWDPNKIIDKGKWLICRDGWLERVYCVCVCVCVYIYIYIYTCLLKKLV